MEGVFLSVCDLSAKPEVDVQAEFFNCFRKRKDQQSIINYKPHLLLEKCGEYLGVQFIKCFDFQGDKMSCTVSLLYYPEVNYDRLIPGQKFDIMEGPKAIGKGVVL